MLLFIGLDVRGQTFEWDSDKAVSNMRKHNVAFQEACEVFFDPFFCLEEEVIRIVSGRPATAEERKIYEHE